ncbi:nucleoside phosphorylase [Clostridium pasteurianum]|uniref:Uridine phosphorylase n=1 Tax=Clostridium pasteurianum BC1 TaxID=86416 RepID=R4K8J4_CLOPA|nr:nucleoside phosphorylase [Clostridium pasteurianum]AGK98888.1 uridine phosphorylase [Clostridium pasteurianum BC1]
MEERINAEMFLEHLASRQGVTINDYKIAPVVIGSWDHNLIKNIAEDFELEPLPNWTKNSTVYNWKTNEQDITFITLPVGAPSAVSTLEQLIARGAKVFIGIGFAGSLQPSVPVGSIVIANNCIREEGTSYHYIKDDSEGLPSERLLDRLQKAFDNEGIASITGGIWTTDAIYRELKSKVEDYGERGILGVEMETSALYVVGKYRGIDVCNVLAISDELWSDWNPQFGSEKLNNTIETVKKGLLNNINLFAELADKLEDEGATA